MTFRLATRNVAKTLTKRLAFGIFFAATVGLLFVGNTVFENSDRGLKTTYVESFSGQATLSAQSPEQFTIFGSDLPLIGEYLVLPVLPNVADLQKKLSRALPSAQILTQVTAAASLEVGTYQAGVPVFGVDFVPYFHFFPALKLIQGSLPPATSPQILLTEWQAHVIESKLGRALILGEPIVLNFAAGTDYVSRKVSFAGVYRYPSEDNLLQRIVLTDPDTARELDGYLYGDTKAVHLDTQSQELMSADVNSLFDDVSATPSESSSPGLNPDSLFDSTDRGQGPVPKLGRVDGAWNFLLVTDPQHSDEQVVKILHQTFSQPDLQVRNWRDTAGGTAEIAWFLRILFNLGLFFIAIVSCLILVNSLSLSILERTKEIGTLRALGASRSFIARLIAWETLLVVVGAGLLGLLVGSLGISALSHAHLALHNVYLEALFGSQTLHLDLASDAILFHLFLIFLLGLAAVILPVRKALSVQPVKAIAREQ